MSVTPFKMSSRVKSIADNYQTMCQVKPIFAKYDHPPVLPSDPLMIAVQSSHNGTNVAASNPHDRTGQQSVAQVPITEDAEGMERTNHISNYQHSDNTTLAMGNFPYMQMPTMREVTEPDNTTYATGNVPYTQIPSRRKVTEPLKNGAAEKRSKQESTSAKLYRHFMRNETCRMMTSIDMVESVAKHLFGFERTQIFFDLLDDELFHFGSAGAISGFVPNMAESAVRHHVISFFEHVCNMMNRLMTLLLSCPDSKRLQQMPEQKFISLMWYVISSSLNTKAKEGQRLSWKETKGPTLIMVDSEEFERALGEEVPEDVLDRLMHGDERVVHRFVDTRLEQMQASERRENRPIYSIFFPSDNKLFIYIPTENGSYWHMLDMWRANRLS